MFRDSFGLIVTQSGDGGDSLRYEGCFWLANYLRQQRQMKEEYSALTPHQVIAQLEVRPGIVARHPNPLEWWSDPKNTSRDQTLSAFILGQLYDRQFLYRLVRAHRERYWICSNGTDNLWFTSVPNRAMGGWHNLLLYITDWFFFFDYLNAIGLIPTYNDGKKKWVWYDATDTGKFWNASLAMCQPGHETFIRRLVRWTFANFASTNAGTKLYNESHPIIAGLKWEARNDTPDLAAMWAPIIECYFPRRRY